MSVIYFSDKELSEVYGKLSFFVAQNYFFVDIGEAELEEFLVRVGLCNRLAYEYNYHRKDSEKIVLKIPKVEVSEWSQMSLKELIERLGLLEYNCVTNSGRSFLDSEDKKLIEGLVHNLRFRYIKFLEKRVKS